MDKTWPGKELRRSRLGTGAVEELLSERKRKKKLSDYSGLVGYSVVGTDKGSSDTRPELANLSRKPQTLWMFGICVVFPEHPDLQSLCSSTFAQEMIQ